jgi:hypothetical protein
VGRTRSRMTYKWRFVASLESGFVRRRLAAGQPRDRARDGSSEPADESRLRALVGLLGEVLGDEFGEADQRNVHLVVFESFLHHHAAIRTGCDNRIDTDFLDL